MNQRPGSVPEPERDDAAARPGAAFRNHLMIYLVTGVFLVTLNLLTSPRSLWFYWPLFFWGWALVFQAVKTFGADAPAQVLATLRSLVPGAGSTASGQTGRNVRETAGPAALESVEERVKRLWRTARQIPEGPVRDQAFRICAAADRVAEVMSTDRTDPGTVAWFDAQLLAPTEDLLSRYSRLRGRDIAGAEDTLRRVEAENLPQIEARLDALYDQLHRGEIVDLAVASEMLDIELPAMPPSARSTGAYDRR
ncbi:MAG: 2TM domain-containing protein [Thermomicrobiales bacterium]